MQRGQQWAEGVRMDCMSCIFGNQIPDKVRRKAARTKAGYVRRFGDDSNVAYTLETRPLPVIGERLGVRDICIAAGSAGGSTSTWSQLDLEADAAAQPMPPRTSYTRVDAQGAPVVVGNIRMGFGHYRIAMAMASAAHAMGYTPYWLDLCSLQGTTCSKVIGAQNDLYSLGSRTSQRSRLFNHLVWEPMNYEGFRKLSYNASDQKVSELLATPLRSLPPQTPFIGTHVWPSQAAVHAGLTHVVNAIPDNWPMALHLAEGSLHTVQTPGAYMGYKELRGMDGRRVLKPMPENSIVYTGHYVDHELVSNIELDCAARLARRAEDAPVRYLLTVGGAGAQQDLYTRMVEHLLPAVEAGRATLLVNVGDHKGFWDSLVRAVPRLSQVAQLHFDDFDATAAFADAALTGVVEGVHVFCHADIFAAVYSTNLLMRACDVLVTKPGELSFYPVPKLMVHRVGGHERWGAIRAAELGDGTYEVDTPEETMAFLDAFQQQPDLIATMCDCIRTAAAAGIYDGAYKVVDLAASGAKTR